MRKKHDSRFGRYAALAAVLCLCAATAGADRTVTGEPKKWHKITIGFTGPDTDETADPNPFTDYRLDVAFSNGSTTYTVPGYYAADGNAAHTGASSGNVWLVHFAPDRIGTWTWKSSFTSGPGVAQNGGGRSAGFFDAKTGSFTVADTDKTGRDLRAKGMLRYVGKHYLQLAETAEYFLKQGADSPENFLACADFDGNFKNDGRHDKYIKKWRPHVRDWQKGDPTWAGGKGKGIIGAINYLASEGMNAFSFLTMNIAGDDRNVFPYLDYEERLRMDCSRLAQWEIVFEHATRMGMFLHFKTQETENELLLDNGNLGPQRKLYYRELIARFAHHPALNWNLGEEINDASTKQKKAWAKYFRDNDPYRHHIVIHNMLNTHHDLLGPESHLTGISLQTFKVDFRETHGRVLDYIRRSAARGKPWAVACDEPGHANSGIRPDNNAGSSHKDGRRNALWGTLMAGGWGNEWFFGVSYPQSDVWCQDFRSRDRWWDYCRYALAFFIENRLPFVEMVNNNDLSSGYGDYCFFKKGAVYVVYLKKGGTTDLDLSGAGGTFSVRWYDPRKGGALQKGSVSRVSGGKKVNLGTPPDSPEADWAILVTKH